MAGEDRKASRTQQRVAVLNSAEALMRKGYKKRAAIEEAARKHGVGSSSAWGWLRRVKDRPPDEWEALLADDFKGRTALTFCDPEAWEFIKADYLKRTAAGSAAGAVSPLFERHGPVFQPCYRRLVAEAEKRGWRIPAERTLERRLKALAKPD